MFTRHAVVPPVSTSGAAVVGLQMDAISVLVMRNHSRTY
jgi:hypothetical protein